MQIIWPYKAEDLRTKSELSEFGDAEKSDGIASLHTIIQPIQSLQYHLSYSSNAPLDRIGLY
jgi:hypothetical protein